MSDQGPIMRVSEKGNLLFNTGVLTGSNIFIKIAAYIYFWIIAREFSAEQFGVYALLITSYLLMELSASFGFDKIIIRELSRTEEDQANAAYFFSLFVRAGLAIAAFMACLATYRLLYADVLVLHALEVLCVLGAVFPLIASRSIESYFTALEKMHIPATSQLVERLVILAAAGLVPARIIGFRGFLVGFFLAVLTRSLILVTLFPWDTWNRRSALTPKRRRALFSQAAQVALVEISAIIYFRVDVLMLSKMTDFTSTGMYQVAYKIFDFFITLFAGFLIAVFPKISREGHQAPVGRYLGMGMPLMTVLAMVVIYFRFEILAFFQPAFIPAASALIFLMLSLPLVFCNSLLANYLVAARRIGMLVRLALVLVPLNIGLNFFLIPRFGIEGAASATLLCELCLAALFVLGLTNALPWNQPTQLKDVRSK
ncbi:MAG: oligosaccharide flippase family protein [Desulfobacteraceae bacterium]|nr:oligosaccharide flippase family protein [Desulfobacteraceae bacterium]